MRISERDREDYSFLTATADAALAQGISPFFHLDQAIGRWNYIRIANEIAERVLAGRLLDWGCGYGQMTYLLRRRGFDVTPFDVRADAKPLPVIPLNRELNVVLTTHPTKLPFDDTSFDAVLSCGVLEHVDEFSALGNEIESLREIRRVLRPAGHFVIYQLPQQSSWQEALIRLVRLGYAHPRRYSEREIRTMLAANGYEVERLERNNLFPKNLTGAPERVRTFYSRFSRALIDVDSVLCRVPALNRLAGVLELIARRLP